MSDRTGERPDGPSFDGGAMLVVQIQGGHGEPERLLHISPPLDGRVMVREWTSEGGGFTPREHAVAEVLAQLERSWSERRRMSEDLYSIRRWLGAAESGGGAAGASHADRFRGASGPTESER